MVLGRSRVLRPGTQPDLDAHTSMCSLPRCVRDSVRATKILGTVSRHGSQAYWAVWSATKILALCHNRNFVSRQGLGLGQVWVATRVSLGRDRVFPKGGILCRDRVPSVATKVGTTPLWVRAQDKEVCRSSNL